MGTAGHEIHGNLERAIDQRNALSLLRYDVWLGTTGCMQAPGERASDKRLGASNGKCPPVQDFHFYIPYACRNLSATAFRLTDVLSHAGLNSEHSDMKESAGHGY